ncbi:hypothetical protein V8E54_013470 [Elaphomyces granulatus]
MFNSRKESARLSRIPNVQFDIDKCYDLERYQETFRPLLYSTVQLHLQKNGLSDNTTRYARTDESDEMKIDTFNEEAGFSCFPPSYYVDDDDPDMDIDGLELRTARFLGSPPVADFAARWMVLNRAVTPTNNHRGHRDARSTNCCLCDTSQLHGRVCTGLLQPFAEETEPAPLAHRTVMKLLRLSPCLELLRYDNMCPRRLQDGSLLTAALKQVGVGVYSGEAADELKAPIVTLLGWSPGEFPLRLTEVVPAGLTHLSLTEDLVAQCTYEWDEQLVLDELKAFLSVWRTVTPDLQVVEVWLCHAYDRWKDENVAELPGVLCIVHLNEEPSCSLITYQ